MTRKNTQNPTDVPGFKLDEGKPDMSLLTMSRAMEKVVRVLEFGMKKGYPKDNWRKVEDRSRRYRAAAMRHMMEDLRSNGAIDPESKQTHIAHAVCDLLFLLDEE